MGVGKKKPSTRWQKKKPSDKILRKKLKKAYFQIKTSPKKISKIEIKKN